MPTNPVNKSIIAALTALIVSICIWIVSQTHCNAVAIADVKALLQRIDQKVDDGKAARYDFQQRTEKHDEVLSKKVDELMSRREFSDRITPVEASIKTLSDSLAAINLRISKIEAGMLMN